MRRIAIEDLTVAEIMSKCPATIRLFLEWRLHCIGCPIAPFHTLNDAAREHDVSAEDLIAAMEAALAEDFKGDPV